MNHSEVDPTLPRFGTDLIAAVVHDGDVDPTLPRFGTDLIAAVVHDWARLTRRYRGLKAALQLHAPLAMIQLI